MTRALMIQGTGSNVGKSLLVAGLCRAARRRGIDVAPFKPQNMSNNAAVTADGGEIGRAQALQALACGLEPVSDMNPVLLKPETDTGAQVVVQGRRRTTTRARDYWDLKPQLMGAVLESFGRLRGAHELVIVEGAGSPAEVNLRRGDIANMGFARAADVPVVLAGDIDRGGVIAQIIGTQAVLDPADAAMISDTIVWSSPSATALLASGITRASSSSNGSGRGETAPAMKRISPIVVGGMVPLNLRDASTASTTDGGRLSSPRMRSVVRSVRSLIVSANTTLSSSNAGNSAARDNR